MWFQSFIKFFKEFLFLEEWWVSIWIWLSFSSVEVVGAKQVNFFTELQIEFLIVKKLK